MVDLNTLVSSSSGIQLVEAVQINNRGEIAAQGPDASGNNHAVLLIPCDGNHPNVTGCDYGLVDAATVAKPELVHGGQSSSAAGNRSRMPMGLSGRRYGPMLHGPNRFGSFAPN